MSQQHPTPFHYPDPWQGGVWQAPRAQPGMRRLKPVVTVLAAIGIVAAGFGFFSAPVSIGLMTAAILLVVASAPRGDRS